MRIIFIASYVQKTPRIEASALHTKLTNNKAGGLVCIFFFCVFFFKHFEQRLSIHLMLWRGVHPALKVLRTFFSHRNTPGHWGSTEMLDTERKLRLNKVKGARGKANALTPKGSRTCSSLLFALHQWKTGNLAPKEATWARVVVKKITSSEKCLTTTTGTQFMT